MKKITSILFAIIAAISFTKSAMAVGHCELEVTRGDVCTDGPGIDWDPCVVINRAGYKTDEEDELGEYIWEQVGKYGSGDACKVIQDEGGKAGTDVYFECQGDQAHADKCTMEFIASKKEDCWIGDHNGYSTKLVLFQTENTPTPALHHNVINPMENDANDHLGTIIAEPFTLQLSPNEQYIYSDAYPFWDAFDNSHECLGSACGDANLVDIKSSYWAEHLINDTVPEGVTDGDAYMASNKISYILKPDNYAAHDRTTIVDVLYKADDGKRPAGEVPITVDIPDGEYAIIIKGPSTLQDGEKASIMDIRGWNVTMKSGAGLIYTEGHVNIIIQRSIFNMSDLDVSGLFSLSPETTVSYKTNKTVSDQINNMISSVTDGSDDDSNILPKEEAMEIIMGGNQSSPIIYREVPAFKQFESIAPGLHIDFNPKLAQQNIPLPILIEGAGEIECSVNSILECISKSEANQVMVFSRQENTHVIHFYDDQTAFDTVDSFIYIVSGQSNIGDRIIFEELFDTDKDGVYDEADNCVDTENQDQIDTDGDELGDECDDDDVLDEEDNCPLSSNQDQDDKDDDGIGDVCDTTDDTPPDNIDNNTPSSGSYSPPEPIECPEGEYLSQHFKVCRPLHGGSKTSGSDNVASNEDNDPPTHIDGVHPEGDEIEMDGDANADADEEYTAAASSGCSLAASGAEGNAMHMLLPLIGIALIGMRSRKRKS